MSFFISDAYAQEAGGQAGTLELILPLVLMFGIFYFLLIRPQQKRAKEHREMVSKVRRGDTVVTGGGIVGKVTKVDSGEEVQIEIADGVRVKVLSQTLADVRSRGEPASDAGNDN